MDKRIIVFGGDQRMAAVAASGARRYLGTHKQFTVSMEELDAGIRYCIPKMFGLMHSFSEYEDRLDEPLPDFFGHSARSVQAKFLDQMLAFGGPAALGRAMARRIRFNTQAHIYMLHKYDTAASLVALSLEPSINGPKNMLLVWCGEQPTMEGHHRIALDVCVNVTLPIDDIETMHLLIRGTIKKFLHLEE